MNSKSNKTLTTKFKKKQDSDKEDEVENGQAQLDKSTIDIMIRNLTTEKEKVDKVLKEMKDLAKKSK